MSESVREQARWAFRERFGREPEVVEFAPGRVNLIGEHIDYNGGIVFPMALGLGTAVALGERKDRCVRIASTGFEQEAWIDPTECPGAPSALGFERYILAAFRVWGSRPEHAPDLDRGFDIQIASDLPIGAGLSSSAALLVATLRALAARARVEIPASDLAEWAHLAEREHVGVSCGRMDHYACALAAPGQALWFDCRTLRHQVVALPLDLVRVVVVDSGTRRELVDSKYNERVTECQDALRAVQRLEPSISDLCEVSPSLLQRIPRFPTAESRRRAEHCVGEIERVRAFRSALERRDPIAAGRILNEGHASLRDLYQVSTAALDALQSILIATPDCLGARLTGAGFGGCLVALVRPGSESRVARDVLDPKWHAVGCDARVFPAVRDGFI